MNQPVFKSALNIGRAISRVMVVVLAGSISVPAHANPLTDFASQMADQAWTHIETALGNPPGPTFSTESRADEETRSAGAGTYDTNQPGLNPNSKQPRTSRPATALMVSQAGMAALENMRVGGASFDMGAGRQEQPAPTPVTPVMAGLTDNQVREAIVRDHMASYVTGGRCMCPNQPDKTGQPCGHKAGYGHSNTNVAVCYTSQIDQRMVWEWRSTHQAAH